MTIIEMREKRAKLWNTMEGFLDTHRNDKGVLSAEDDATYSAMEQDLNDLSNEIRRMERRDAMEAELNKPVGTPIKETPEKPNAEMQKGRASNAYKEDFGRHLRGKAPIHNVLSESTDADGGYLVPEEFERDIVTGLDAVNVVRSIAKVITTQNDRKIPISVGHSVANWTAENAAFTESNPTFGQKEIDAYKLTDLIRISVELLQDAAFPLEEYIANEFARAFGAAEEEAFCVGNGTGRPTGIFTANGGAVGVTAAANNAITADELINLVYALKAPYRRNAKFLMNDATISAIRKLKDGDGNYLLNKDATAKWSYSLFGHDVYVSQSMPDMAAGKRAVLYLDPAGLAVKVAENPSVQVLREKFADEHAVGVICWMEVDSKVENKQKIAALDMKAAVTPGG